MGDHLIYLDSKLSGRSDDKRANLKWQATKTELSSIQLQQDVTLPFTKCTPENNTRYFLSSNRMAVRKVGFPIILLDLKQKWTHLHFFKLFFTPEEYFYDGNDKCERFSTASYLRQWKIEISKRFLNGSKKKIMAKTIFFKFTHCFSCHIFIGHK